MTDYVIDTFTRNVGAGGWTSADLGGAYTLSGTTTNFAVNGTKGTISCPASNTRAAALLAVPTTAQDSVVSADFTFDQPVVGTGTSGITFGLEARRTNAFASQNNYRAKIMIPAPGAGQELRLRLSYTLNNVENTLTTPLDTFNAAAYNGRVFHLKFLCQNINPTILRAKYWLDSDPEPNTWFANWTTDAQAVLQAAGSWGVFVAGGAGNVTELVTVDNFSAVSPPAGWTTKPAKVWNGTAWVTKPAKVWDGTSWVTKPTKVWMG